MLNSELRVLSKEDIEAVHATSMKLLAEVGVAFPTDEAITLFKKHGVKTDGHLVYITEEQVARAVKSAPARFTIRARNLEKSVTVGDGNPVFAPGYGAPFLVDPETGKRTPTMEDY
ncbi:MAG TPA: trimethylamine methyltransferase, partial [Chloroflexi bacterium]|nr:trimethylamine methyltransferase [Chloroflexota bacterium]